MSTNTKDLDLWVKEHDARLWQRHRVQGIKLYYRPPKAACGGPSHRWMLANSIPADTLYRYFVKVIEAADLLGITAKGVLAAIKTGGISGPFVYDYSRNSDGHGYAIWVHRLAVQRYRSTRRPRRRR